MAVKIRFNLEAANDLLPKIKEDHRFKAGTNVLYRAIVDDLINAFYLLCLVQKDDAEQISLGNELNILHKEFLESATEGIEAENTHLADLYNDESKITELSEFREAIIEENPEIFDNGARKNNKSIRETSLPIFQELLKGTNGSGFINEKKKLEIIKTRGPNINLELTAIYKYLSQYQHYSPKAYEMMLTDAVYDVHVYNRTLAFVLVLIEVYFSFIVVADPDGLKQYYNEMASFFESIDER
ncbi:hypothetical protein [Olivibacter sitiensis]|uniref:hypothetical protein n=1 Tax=Olivibacter sitiensis TaxID=376470 RepID=UPI0004186688|nr:hypothetical protein [Olivibacter sitiensis]